MSVTLVLYLLLIHWIADFLCQTTWMASEKHQSNKALLYHTVTYALIMTFEMAPLLNLSIFDIVIFGIVTFACHTIQDYITSRMTHAKFQAKIYNGWNGAFTIIGFDQFLHFIQLFLTYHFLTL